MIFKNSRGEDGGEGWGVISIEEMGPSQKREWRRNPATFFLSWVTSLSGHPGTREGLREKKGESHGNPQLNFRVSSLLISKPEGGDVGWVTEVNGKLFGSFCAAFLLFWFEILTQVWATMCNCVISVIYPFRWFILASKTQHCTVYAWSVKFILSLKL